MTTRKWLFIILLLAAFLRLWKLGEVPISLHGDEVGVGYNAYTLLTQGVDEYGKRLPLSFRSDVTPLIFYATVPTIALFGLTEFAIRIPSVVIGLSTIVAFYMLTYEISLLPQFRKLTRIKNAQRAALLSALFLTISPWHIQVSRIAHDAGYGIFLQIFALLLFLQSVRLRLHWMFALSTLMFILSMYSYHGPRITSPLLLGALIFIYRIKIGFQKSLNTIIFFLLGSLPLVLDFLSKPLADTRLGGINIVNRGPGEQFSIINLLIKIGTSFVRQFDVNALFFNSEATRYFNVFHVGLLYFIFLPLLFITFIILFRNRHAFSLVILLITIAVLPGALTSGPANAGRILLLFPILEFLSASGLLLVFRSTRQPNMLKIVTVFLIGLSFGHFLHQYFINSPLRFSQQWQQGMKEMATSVVQKEAEYDHIIVSDKFKQAYIYVLFYGKKPIEWLQGQPNLHRHSYIGYDRFGKYAFRPIDWSKDAFLKNALLATPPDELPLEKISQFINRSEDKSSFILISTNP